MSGWTAPLTAVSIICAVLAWIAVVGNRLRVRDIRQEREHLRLERQELEDLRRDVWRQLGDMEAEHAQLLRQRLPVCDKCGMPFRQTGPKDFDHSFCPAET